MRPPATSGSERTPRATSSGAVWAAAGLLLLLFASQMYVWINWWPIRISWLTALAWSLPQFLLWMLATPLAAAASRRWPLDGGRALQRVAGHLGASVAFALAGLLVLDLSDRLLHWAPLVAAPTLVTSVKYTIVQLHWGTAIYWLVLAAEHSLRYQADSRGLAIEADQASAAASAATLTALRSQLHPHFLFNTLNSIAVLVRLDPPRAEEMVHRLAEFLRLTLEQSDRALVPLEEEIEFARCYLVIEQQRFEHRLTVTIAIEPDTRRAAVPTLLIQPLVENAVRHGVARRPQGGRIAIHSRRVDGHLELVVANDGPAPTALDHRAGFGLEATRRRLAAQYHGSAQFDLVTAADGAVEARILLPLTLDPELAAP